MNMSEFKAWFYGFTENIDGAPSAKQWKRIREQVGQIDETDHVFMDSYVPQFVEPSPQPPFDYFRPTLTVPPVKVEVISDYSTRPNVT